MSASNVEENRRSKSVIMIGATGAVGSHVVTALQTLPQLGKLTILGRRA